MDPTEKASPPRAPYSAKKHNILCSFDLLWIPMYPNLTTIEPFISVVPFVDVPSKEYGLHIMHILEQIVFHLVPNSIYCN